MNDESNPTKSDEQKKQARGKAFAQWLRKAMTNPLTNTLIMTKDVARITGVSPSMIGVYLNNCFDRSKSIYKFPRASTIEKLASALKADVNEGLAAADLLPGDSTDTVIRLEPGMTRHKLRNGNILLIPADEENPEQLVAMYNSFLLGLELNPNLNSPESRK